MSWRNLIRAGGEKRLLLVAVLSFLAGFVIGSIRGFEHGAAAQAHLDALVSLEGREHVDREESNFYWNTAKDVTSTNWSNSQNGPVHLRNPSEERK